MPELDLNKTIWELEEITDLLDIDWTNNWEADRFEVKTLEQINKWKRDVEAALLIWLTEKEINHIEELNKILDIIKLSKKLTLIECSVLIVEYSDKSESFEYEGEDNLASKIVLSNLNNILSSLNIDINSINFDMAREYINNNPKK